MNIDFSELKDVEIFEVGTWKGIDFNIDFLKEVVENTQNFFDKGTSKPPLKLGHSTNQILKGQTDGDPALGWVQNVRLKGNKIIADFKNVPDVVYKLIKQKRYDKLSSEIRRNTEAGYFLKGVALLGADLPAVKTLGDLSQFVASESENDLKDSEINFSIDEPIIEIQKEKENMSEEKKDNSLELDFAEAKRENEALKAKIEKYEKEKIELIFSEKKNDVLKDFKQDVEKGLLTPATLIKIEKEVDSQLCNFSENSEITFSASLVKEIKKGYSEKLPEGEQASSDVKEPNSDPVIEFSEKARAIQIDKGITYEDASKIAAEKYPELVNNLYK